MIRCYYNSYTFILLFVIYYYNILYWYFWFYRRKVLTPQRRRAKNGMCKLEALNPETNMSQLYGKLLNGKLSADAYSVPGACFISLHCLHFTWGTQGELAEPAPAELRRWTWKTCYWDKLYPNRVFSKTSLKSLKLRKLLD